MTRILVVDDREENLRYLETFLGKYGYTVDSAAHGAEALGKARLVPPDLLISDLLMPVMDGYALLRQWKADASLSKIPFIIFTATFTEADDQRLGENLGADAFILKTVKSREFLTRVQQVLAAAGIASHQPSGRTSVDDEKTTLNYYSQRLIHKLEEKSRQLEQANLVLQQEITEHRKTDEELRFNNAIMKTQLQNSLDAILVVNREGNVLSFNDQFIELWDIPKELLDACRETPLLRTAQLMRVITERVVAPESYLGKIEYLRSHPNEKSFEEVQFRDGKITEIYSAPAIGPGERYYGRIWYCRDVTESRRAHASLEAGMRKQRHLTQLLEIERSRLLAAQQIAKVGSWETDLTSMTTLWSDAVHSIFGTDPATFKPAHAAFLALVHPDDRLAVDKAFKESITRLEASKLEHRVVLPDGQTRFVEENWRILRDEEGKPVRVLGTCLDITAHKLLLESLREKAVQLSNAQRIGRMGSWSSDVRTGRIIWTEATCELFGITLKEFDGTVEKFRSFILPEDLPAFDQVHAQVSVSEPLLEMEFRIRRPDGRVRWMYIRGNTGFDSAGTAVSRAGMIMDVTDQRETSEQLARNSALLRIAGRMARIGGWSLDVSLGKVFWSDDVCLLHDMPVGFSPTLEEAIAFYTEDFRELISSACLHCIEKGISFDLELQLVTARGRRIWVRTIGEARGNAENNTRQIQGAIQDISEQKAAQDEIHGLGNRLIETLESTSDGFFTIDHNWNFTYINVQAERLMQRSRADLLGRNVWQEFNEAVGTKMQHNCERAMVEKVTLAFEEFYPPLNAWFEVSVYPSQDGVAVYFRDVTSRKDTEAQLAYLHRVRAVISGISALIIRVQSREELFQEACNIAYDAGQFPMVMLCMVNPVTLKIEPVASRGKDEALLATVRNTLASDERAGKTMIARAIRNNTEIVSNDSSHDPQVLFGERYRAAGVQSIAVLPLANPQKSIGALVLYAREIGFFQKNEMSLLTELADDIAFAVDHIEKQERLDYLANFDTLTGLANRELFLERLEQYMGQAAATGGKLAVCLINLERFKSINDTLGRPSGDSLLRLVAEWLVRTAGDANHLARIGADQFAIVIYVKPEGNLIKLLESLHRAFQETLFTVNATSLRMAAKSGVALFPDDGSSADVLFRNAEVALKEVKTTNERFVFYASQMNIEVAARLTLETRLRQAVANEEFVLYYQPKVSLASGKVTGAEALIRWNDPQGNLVLPGNFIHILEECDLIADVGRWALKKATEDYLRWRKAGLPAVRIAVNVSPLQLNNRNFIADLERHAGNDELGDGGLELEITEGVIMENITSSTASLRAIRAMGITIAIDDFGTGFSSLSYLAKLPVDSLKIDRSFVDDMMRGPAGLALVSTIIGLAHALNLKVVAEGVETEEQMRMLRLLKCNEMQGYLVSRALPVEEFEKKFLRASFSLSI